MRSVSLRSGVCVWAAHGGLGEKGVRLTTEEIYPAVDTHALVLLPLHHT